MSKIVGDGVVIENMAAKLLAYRGGLWYSTKNTTSEGEVTRKTVRAPIDLYMKICQKIFVAGLRLCSRRTTNSTVSE